MSIHRRFKCSMKQAQIIFINPGNVFIQVREDKGQTDEKLRTAISAAYETFMDIWLAAPSVGKG